MGTDHDWKRWGKDDPYFGVASDEGFRTETLTDASREAFFRTGEAHIEGVLAAVRAHFDPGFEPGASLDFGCGVGRLLVPLARRSRQATGVDISPDMLAETAANCAAAGLGNTRLVLSDDTLSRVAGEFDLVHSHIVLQHIDPNRGYRIVAALAGKVRMGGFLAIQLPHAWIAPWFVKALVQLRYRVPLANAVRNLARGRPLGEPAMQLHAYSLSRLLPMLREVGLGPALALPDASVSRDFESVMLLARRERPHP